MAVIIAELVGEGPLSCLTVDVLVDTCGRAIGKQRFVIQVVVLVVTEALPQACSLVEQTLIKHDVSRGGLGLTQGNLLRDVAVGIPFVLGLV